MDLIALLFYAIVCAALGISTPAIASRWVRLLVGAAVGLVSAGALPILRGFFGV